MGEGEEPKLPPILEKGCSTSVVFLYSLQPTSSQGLQNYQQLMMSPFLWYYLATSWRTEAGQGVSLYGRGKWHRYYKIHVKNWRPCQRYMRSWKAWKETAELLEPLEWGKNSLEIKLHYVRSLWNMLLLFWISCMDKQGFAHWDSGAGHAPMGGIWHLNLIFTPQFIAWGGNSLRFSYP